MTSSTKGSSLSLGNKEEYFIADLFSKGNPIAHGVKSKLVFNELKFKKPLLFLFPVQEPYQKMKNIFEFEIKGFFEYVGGEKAGEIYIPKAYLTNTKKLYHASSWTECRMEIFPDEIFYKRYIINEKEGTTKARIVFLLTENKIAKPWGSIMQSFTGEVSPEFTPRIILEFNDAWEATIEEHYNFADAKIDDIEGNFSSGQLVLTIEKANHILFSIDEVETISRWVDNMLLYLSFGSRQRTTWVKWSAIINNEYIEFFRNNVSIPALNNEKSLIDQGSPQEFLTHCLFFSNQKENLDLHLPIVYLTGASRQDKTIESQFLSLFMSLEALLDLYGEKNNKNKHLTGKTNPKWKDFYDYLSKAINDMTDIQSELKETFIKKLGSLNKISKRFLYKDFCKEYAIDNSDLWPIYGNKEFDLNVIRNDLIHGRRSKYESILDIATGNLRWIIERCILAVLGWKGKTDSILQYTAYCKWKNYINDLKHL